MANKKFKEIQKMDEKAREERLKDLRFELARKSLNANKQSKGKSKEIKKAIARILTIQTKQSLEKI